MRLVKFGGAVLAAVLLLGACGRSTGVETISTTPPAGSKTAALMAKAPKAYAGNCQVVWRGRQWRQPNLYGSGSPFRSDGEAPVPCANVRAEIGMTGASANPPLKPYKYTETISGDDFVHTDDIWIRATKQANHDWLIEWGVKPGRAVEWFLVFDGPDKIPAKAGRFVWHSVDPVKSYPSLSVYANLLDESGNVLPRGVPIPITGPPVANP